MKADFGKKKKTNQDEHNMFKGGYEQMVKERKKKLPELEAAINDVLKDYDGGTIAIITIKEDENGDAEGHSLFIGGVSKLETQIALGRSFIDASEEIRDKLLDVVKENPQAFGTVLSALLEELAKRAK
jgi:tRNA/tmRNA/rRNA uracil-C5-methylase (TrmA/RlmC/RlmD family)